MDRQITLPPLSPAELADLAGLDAPTALDAYLVVGGFPALALAWGRARDLATFLRRELPDPTSPLVVVGERMMAAEFPPEAQARLILGAIGAGERTFSGIAAAAGIPKVGLQRALELLVAKRVVEKITPLSAKPSRLSRYLVADHYLRSWLRYVGPGLEEILRGRGDLVVERVLATWSEYRGARSRRWYAAASSACSPTSGSGARAYLGSCWTRDGEVELDLVGTPTASPAPRLRLRRVGQVE